MANQVAVFTAAEGATTFTSLGGTPIGTSQVQAQTTHFSYFGPGVPSSGSDAGPSTCPPSTFPNPGYDAACNPNGGNAWVCNPSGSCIPNCSYGTSVCDAGTSCGINGHCVAGPGCAPDAGSAPFVGSWSGTTTTAMTYTNGSPASGGGGGGRDSEAVIPTDCGFAFQSYFSVLLVNCTLPWAITSSTDASLISQAVCRDTMNGYWTFDNGTASLDPSGALMVQTGGTFTDPVDGSGTFTTTSNLQVK
ncbi:MAG: hypothetical protein ACYDCL_01910 [Myxococcales bacterium]